VQIQLKVYVILLLVLLVTGRIIKDKQIQQIQISLYVLLVLQLKLVVLNVIQVMGRLVLNVLLDFFIQQDKLEQHV
jgi:hypothetical protein